MLRHRHIPPRGWEIRVEARPRRRVGCQFVDTCLCLNVEGAVSCSKGVKDWGSSGTPCLCPLCCREFSGYIRFRSGRQMRFSSL